MNSHRFRVKLLHAISKNFKRKKRGKRGEMTLLSLFQGLL